METTIMDLGFSGFRVLGFKGLRYISHHLRRRRARSSYFGQLYLELHCSIRTQFRNSTPFSSESDASLLVGLEQQLELLVPATRPS